MKKLIYALVGILTVLFVLIIVFSIIEDEVEVSSYEEIQQKFEDEETFLFVIGSTNCNFCDEYLADGLRKYVNKNPKVDVVYVDLLDLAHNGISSAKFFEEFGIDISTFEGTPTTYFVKDGKVNNDDVLTGPVSYTDIQKMVNRNLK